MWLLTIFLIYPLKLSLAQKYFLLYRFTFNENLYFRLKIRAQFRKSKHYFTTILLKLEIIVQKSKDFKIIVLAISFSLHAIDLVK